jgi:hypothetical protein
MSGAAQPAAMWEYLRQRMGRYKAAVRPEGATLH